MEALALARAVAALPRPSPGFDGDSGAGGGFRGAAGVVPAGSAVNEEIRADGIAPDAVDGDRPTEAAIAAGQHDGADRDRDIRVRDAGRPGCAMNTVKAPPRRVLDPSITVHKSASPGCQAPPQHGARASVGGHVGHAGLEQVVEAPATMWHSMISCDLHGGLELVEHVGRRSSSSTSTKTISPRSSLCGSSWAS
jgi:hypothetical protein